MEQNMKEVVQDLSVDLCNNEEPEKATLKKRRNALADIFHGVDAKAVEPFVDMSGIAGSVHEEEMLKIRWEAISGEKRNHMFVLKERGRRNGMGDIFQDIYKAESDLNTPHLFDSCENLEILCAVKQY
ncbi:hypothetical protein ACJMK2_005596 [Sinanodonta woodiana]|uniref:Uncharacterized protein n=1 Tax=Sinanodonta woodiana TaxID=1069815 RepID=A0ABD3VQK4_SINWO